MELSDIYKELKEQKRKKKRSNVAYSTRRLHQEGIPVEVFNNGVHLRLRKDTEAINFYPSTGLWWIMGTKNKRRGIDSLILYMTKGLKDVL